MSIQRTVFIILAIALALLLLGPVALGSQPVGYALEKAGMIASGAIHYALEALGWIVAGILLGGLAMEFIPRQWFVQELGGTDARTMFKASLMGIFIDVCSHGALAIGISLYKAGASVSSTVTFLLATPWLGLMETMLLIGLLGWKIALAVIITSLLAAFTIGVVMGALERRGLIGGHGPRPKLPRVKIRADARKRLSGFDWGTLPRRVASGVWKGLGIFAAIGGWIAIGLVMTGVMLAFVTPEQVASLMGYASSTALPFTALLATLIEVCSEGSVPLVAAFSNMGASIGAVFVFLMAGVASDITELGTIADVIGKRAAIATLLVAVTVSIIYGYLLNWAWLAFAF